MGIMNLMLDHLDKFMQKAAQAATQTNVDDGKQSKLRPHSFFGGCFAFLMHTDRAAALSEVLPTPINACMPSLLVLQKSTYACKPLQSKAHGVNAGLAAGVAIKESLQEGSWSLWRPSASLQP